MWGRETGFAALRPQLSYKWDQVYSRDFAKAAVHLRLEFECEDGGKADGPSRP